MCKRQTSTILLRGLGIGLFVGFLDAMAKGWMAPENDVAGRWKAIGIGMARAFWSYVVLGRAMRA